MVRCAYLWVGGERSVHPHFNALLEEPFGTGDANGVAYVRLDVDIRSPYCNRCVLRNGRIHTIPPHHDPLHVGSTRRIRLHRPLPLLSDTATDQHIVCKNHRTGTQNA
jgi:hypothetical protein